MDVHVRQRLVLTELRRHTRIHVTELATKMAVSEMTVRRDLETLEREGLLRRVHGGAVPLTSGSYEPGFRVRERLHTEAKTAIGRRAAELVGPNESVIVDAGTTALAVAQALRGHGNLTVCALSVHAAAILGDDPDIRVLVAGGDIRAGDQCFVGAMAERIFDDFSFDTYVMSVGGIDTRGLSDFYPEDARIKRIASANAQRRIIVADGEKFGRTAFARIGGLTGTDLIVTDTSAPASVRETLTGLGARVEVAR